jgi:hypothetical protein
MKKLGVVLVVVLAVVLLSLCASAADLLTVWEREQLSRVDLNGVSIYYGGDTYYLTQKRRERQHLILALFKQNRGTLSLDSANAIFESLSESPKGDVASIDERGVVQFHRAGRVVFRVAVEGQSVELPVEVKEAPYKFDILDPQGSYVPEEEVVRKLGKPDSITRTYLPWYERSTILDGMFYAFGRGNIEVIHWHYTAYPGLVFRMSGGKLVEIRNRGWDCGYTRLLNR